MKKLKIKITLLGLVACLAVYQMTPIKAFVNDVNLLSYQLIASAHAEESTTEAVTCYAIISSATFNGDYYRRCNSIVTCSESFYGKNPKDKSKCTPTD